MELKTIPDHRFRYTQYPVGTKLNEQREPAKAGEKVHFIADTRGDGVRAVPVVNEIKPTLRADGQLVWPEHGDSLAA